MTKVLTLKLSQRNKIALVAILVAGLVLLFGGIGKSYAAHVTPLTEQLDRGESGAEVTKLQTFLANDRNIYPAGLITGYFGPLTEAAVRQFQVSYGIDPVGRVGPVTLSRINSVIASGRELDVTAPSIGSVMTSTTRTNATVNWGTNGLTRGKVFYSTAFIPMTEVGANFVEPLVGGTMVPYDSVERATHGLTIPNLLPNTLYYYAIEAMDGSGNVSLTWPSTFRTSQ